MKNKITVITVCLAILFGYNQVRAQDHIYSQFFNSPLYLNPALNGQFEGDLRMNLIYRNQWSAVGNLSYLTATVDFNIPKFGGGLGLMFTRSSEGTAYLNKNSVSGIYSYSVGSDDFVLSFGLQAGATNRKVDWSKLIFSDQIDSRLGYIPGSVSSAEPPAYNNKFYFDAGAGINLVYNNLMVGASLQHLNSPDESFTGTPSKLPVRSIAHASYRISLNPYDDYDDGGPYLIPSVVYYNQGKTSSMSAGFQFKRRNINAGMWYRTNGAGGPDAVVVSLIFDLFINRDGNEKFRMGLSHDATTSRLNYTNTSGTTEGSLSYETSFPNSGNGYQKFEGNRRCYDFY